MLKLVNVKLHIHGSNTQKYNKTKLCIMVLAGSHEFIALKVFFSETFSFGFVLLAIMYTKEDNL